MIDPNVPPTPLEKAPRLALSTPSAAFVADRDLLTPEVPQSDDNVTTVQTPEEAAGAALRSSDQSGYEIKGEIAHGGMGVVYRAWDHDLSREVAIKTLL